MLVIILKYLLAILPTFLMIHILRIFFPYTGLGRIIAIPQILIINTIIIVVGLILTRKLKGVYNGIVWLVIILLTLYLTIDYWPQEFYPPVFEQLLDKIRR